MANHMDKVAKELKNSIEASDKRKPKPYDTQAEVLRVEGSIAWVHIPGGIEETPVRLTINAKEGDMVNIHVANGSAWITGNGTNPPTDDTRAEQVYEAAEQSIDYVAQLVDKDVTVKSITAATGYIDDLYSKNIYTDNIAAATGYIGDLTAVHIRAEDIVADHETVGSLDANYAKINAANVTDLSAQNAWVNKIMVQTGLIAHESDIFTLDAIQVNAANITAGTIDVNRLIVTVGNQKYLVNIDPTTGTPSYEKLDGNIVEPRTITADKIVAHDITVQEITTENLVGTNGWINLNQGKFFFTTNGTTWANTTNGIMWDGTNLKIKGDVNITAGNVYNKTEADAKYATQASLAITNDAITSEVKAREASDNLLLDSDAPNLGAVYASANRYVSDASSTSEYVTCTNVELTDPPEQGIKYARRFVCNGTNTTSVGRAYAFYNTSENIIPYVPNTTYTATWWARCTNGQGQTNCHYPKFDGTTSNSASERITLTSEWQKFTIVFTTGSTPNTNYNRIWFYARFPANTSGTIDICGCKLVAGDAVEAYSTKIEQTANNVLIQATASDTTAAQGGQHLIQSLINVAPSGVTIDASKVNITGVITAINNDTTTTIDGGKITAHSIGSSLITVSDSTNLATANELYESSLPTAVSEVYKIQIRSGYLTKKTATQQYLMLTDYMPNTFKNGDELYYEFVGKAAVAGTVQLRAWGYEGTPASPTAVISNGATIDLTTANKTFSGVITLGNAAWGDKTCYLLGFNDNRDTKSQIYIKNCVVRRKSAGELIVDGSITSDHISSNKIDANKINVGQIQIGDLSGSIGGVNLLTNDKVRKTGTSNGITFSTSSAGPEYIKINGTATNNVDQWVADLQSITAKGMSVTISANALFSNSTGIYFFVSTTKDGALYKNYKQLTWYSNTERRLTIDLESGETLRFLRIFVPSGQTVSGKYRFKVECGNKQTAWTPAQDAYITDIGNDGIKIHSSLTEDNAIVLSSDGMEIFKGGDTSDYSIAKYGDTVRIGKDANQHVFIGPGSFSIGKGANNARQYMNVFIMDGHTPGGTAITGAYYAFALMGPDVDPPSDSLFGFMLGYLCEATGFCAKSMGAGTVVHYDYQTAIGKYNANDSANAFEIGWGTSSTPKNIFEVDVGGNVNIASSRAYKVNGTVVASARAKTTITPTASGVSNYSTYGNSYYEKAGNVVHVHVGVKGVTANTVVAIATLPSGYRPTSIVFGHGTGGSSDNIGYMEITTAGVIRVRSSSGYIGADVTYFV